MRMKNILAMLIILAICFAMAFASHGKFYSIYNNQHYRWKPDSADSHQDTLLNKTIPIQAFENGYIFIRVDGPSTMSTAFYMIFEAWNSFLPNGPFTDSTTTSAPLIFFRDSIIGDSVLQYAIHYAADTAMGKYWNFIVYIVDSVDAPDTIISIENYWITF